MAKQKSIEFKIDAVEKFNRCVSVRDTSGSKTPLDKDICDLLGVHQATMTGWRKIYSTVANIKIAKEDAKDGITVPITFDKPIPLEGIDGAFEPIEELGLEEPILGNTSHITSTIKVDPVMEIILDIKRKVDFIYSELTAPSRS